MDDGKGASQEVIFDGVDRDQWFKPWVCNVDERVEEGVSRG